MPRINIDTVLDNFLSTAPKDRLLRLQSDLNAVLRWKYGENGPVPVKRGRKPKDAQAAKDAIREISSRAVISEATCK